MNSVLIVVAAAALLSVGSAQADSRGVKCADEGGVCMVVNPGMQGCGGGGSLKTVIISYGAQDGWVTTRIDGNAKNWGRPQVKCTNQSFGRDPKPYVPKACYQSC